MANLSKKLQHNKQLVTVQQRAAHRAALCCFRVIKRSVLFWDKIKCDRIRHKMLKNTLIDTLINKQYSVNILLF